VGATYAAHPRDGDGGVAQPGLLVSTEQAGIAGKRLCEELDGCFGAHT
jgi:hypothetical protein